MRKTVDVQELVISATRVVKLPNSDEQAAGSDSSDPSTPFQEIEEGLTNIQDIVVLLNSLLQKSNSKVG